MTMANQGDSIHPPLPGPRYFNPFAFVRSLPDPTGLMLRTRDRYGDTYRLPTVLGPVVVPGDPEGIRAIFTEWTTGDRLTCPRGLTPIGGGRNRWTGQPPDWMGRAAAMKSHARPLRHDTPLVVGYVL